MNEGGVPSAIDVNAAITIRNVPTVACVRNSARGDQRGM
jgi:hypothetical protein